MIIVYCQNIKLVRPMNKSNDRNKLLLHPNFMKTIDDIKKVNITITQNPVQFDFDYSLTTFPTDGEIGLIEEMGCVDLDAKRGQEFSRIYIFSGYDESKLKYLTLEGDAFFTSHSLVIASKEDYIPVNFLTFYFYTRSKSISDGFPFCKYSEDHDADSNYDYVADRNKFLEDFSINNSILFIDGPLIGGNITAYTVDLVESLHTKGIIPIFFVKNSNSNLVTDNIPELKQKYNSDMHWSFNQLKIGQRTSLFIYKDEYNPQNAKVFCYLKALRVSPLRVEFHIETYIKCQDLINKILDMIYYLLLVHGDRRNPQIRPIAIAEKYARDTLNILDIYTLVKSSGLVPTMNQERFGGGL